MCFEYQKKKIAFYYGRKFTMKKNLVAKLGLLTLCFGLTAAMVGCSKPAEEVPATEEAAPATDEEAVEGEEAAPAVEEAAPATDEAAPATDAPATEEAAPATDAPAAE